MHSASCRLATHCCCSFRLIEPWNPQDTSSLDPSHRAFIASPRCDNGEDWAAWTGSVVAQLGDEKHQNRQCTPLPLEQSDRPFAQWRLMEEQAQTLSPIPQPTPMVFLEDEKQRHKNNSWSSCLQVPGGEIGDVLKGRRTAPKGYLFYCPSPYCPRSHGKNGYHKQKFLYNHVDAAHPELLSQLNRRCLRMIPYSAKEPPVPTQIPPSPALAFLLASSTSEESSASRQSSGGLTYASTLSSATSSSQRITETLIPFGRGLSNDLLDKNSESAGHKLLISRAPTTSPDLPAGDSFISQLPLSKHSPPWTQMFGNDLCLPPRAQQVQLNDDPALKTRTRDILHDLTNPTCISDCADAKPQDRATSPKDGKSQDRLLDGSLQNFESDSDDFDELGMTEVIGLCFGAEPVRLALEALSRVPSDDPYNLLHGEHGIQQCPAGTDSSLGSSSNQTNAGATSSNASSSESKKRKTEGAADGGSGEQGDNDKGGVGGGGGSGGGGHGQGPPKRRKMSSKSELRWDCPFDRSPAGVTENAPVCAKAGLKMNDLWYVITLCRYRPLTRPR
jgi:hypothetical protein